MGASELLLIKEWRIIYFFAPPHLSWGRYYYDTYVNFAGYYGGYWSSTPHADDDSAYYLGFDDKEQRENAYYRSDGQSVRAVIE